MKKPMLAVALVAVVVVLAACSQGGGGPVLSVTSTPTSALPPSQQVGLWVSGQGKATYTPDVVFLRLGIAAREKTVAQAQLRAREAMDQIVKALKAKGVPEKDIQTTHFSIQPVYEWREAKRQQELVGYQVSNQVQVKVRPVERAGEVIDAVAEAGGDLTRINDISLGREDLAPFQRQAREQAVKDAVATAQHMAQSAGIKLGKVLYLSESAAVPPPRPIPFALKAEAAPAPPTPILPGELEITVSVQIVYAID